VGVQVVGGCAGSGWVYSNSGTPHREIQQFSSFHITLCKVQGSYNLDIKTIDDSADMINQGFTLSIYTMQGKTSSSDRCPYRQHHTSSNIFYQSD
jgi:hypothetical protein